MDQFWLADRTKGEGTPLLTPSLVDSAVTLDSATDMDVEVSKRSGVVTLKPFTPGLPPAKPLFQRSRKRREYEQAFDRSNKLEILPGVFESLDYSKFLVIKLDDEKRFHDMDMFEVNEEITSICEREPNIVRQSDGSLLIEVTSLEESKKLQSLTLLSGSSARCFPHRTLNTCKGVIRSVDLLKYSEERLEKEFRSQKVIEVKQMKRSSDGTIIPLPVYVLTFDLLRLPPIIKAAWLRLQVKPYVPTPRRCYYCQKFGHVSNNCRRKIKGEKNICNICGQEDHGECNNTPSCVNCRESHPSSSKKCDRYILEKEIQTVKTKDRISFVEAKNRVLSQCIRPGVTFASILDKSKKFNTNFHKESTKVLNSLPKVSNQDGQSHPKKQLPASNQKRRRLSGDEHLKPPKIQSVSTPIANKFELLHDETDLVISDKVSELTNALPCETLQTMNHLSVQAEVHISATPVQEIETSLSSPVPEETLSCSGLPPTSDKEDEVSLPSLEGGDDFSSDPHSDFKSKSKDKSEGNLNSESNSKSILNKDNLTSKANPKKKDLKPVINREIKVPLKTNKGLVRKKETGESKMNSRKTSNKGSPITKH